MAQLLLPSGKELVVKYRKMDKTNLRIPLSSSSSQEEVSGIKSKQSTQPQENGFEESEQYSDSEPLVPLSFVEKERFLMEVSKVCDDVIKKILHYGDDPKLSRVHNFHQKIAIASELFENICYSYESRVELEFNYSVRELLFTEKLQTISRAITYKKCIDIKREKYFATEAKSLISKDLEGNASNILLQVPPESFQTELQLSEIRRSEIKEPTVEITQLQADPKLIPVKDISIQFTQPEISMGSILPIQEEPGIETNHIAKAMNPLEKSIGEAETRLKSIKPPIQKEHEKKDLQNNVSEESDDFKLSSLESIELVQKKQIGLKIDAKTKISNYATKALMLNKNINIQRVQVYNGPPKILQAFSLEHMMGTPAYKSSLFLNERNSKLNKLFSRHTIQEKKLYKIENISKKRTREERQEELVPNDFAVLEEQMDSKPAMRAEFGTREALSEVTPKKSRLEEPVVLADLTTVPSPPAPAFQHMRDEPKSDGQASSPWFFSTKLAPPSKKWREFKYVIQQLEELWTLLAVLEGEKCISAQKFFHREKGDGAISYFTLVRILDKLSLQRKIVLEVKGANLLIKPFEIPYVSNSQYSLLRKEPKF